MRRKRCICTCAFSESSIVRQARVATKQCATRRCLLLKLCHIESARRAIELRRSRNLRLCAVGVRSLPWPRIILVLVFAGGALGQRGENCRPRPPPTSALSAPPWRRCLCTDPRSLVWVVESVAYVSPGSPSSMKGSGAERMEATVLIRSTKRRYSR